MSGQEPDGAIFGAASAPNNTGVSIDPEPEATTTGVLVEEEKEEEVVEKDDAAVVHKPHQQEQTAAHQAAAPAALRHSVPQAVGSGPQYKHQVRDVSQISTILLEADDQGASNSNTSDHQDTIQNQQQHQDHYEPVIMSQAKLLPDADAVDEHSSINFGGDVKQSGRSNNIADGSNIKPGQLNGDGTPSTNNRKQKYWILAGIVLALLIAVIVGVVVAVTQEDEEPFFVMAGQPLNGPEINEHFGTALALSKTGQRMAVASPGRVWVYEYSESDEQWRPLGQPISINGNADGAADLSGSEYNNSGRKLLDLQGDDLISIDINAIGDRLVVGHEMYGWVQIFRYLDEWSTEGERIERTEDRFGASVSMSADGKYVAVGAPGQGGSAGYSFVFQQEASGNWGLLGSPIEGEDSAVVTQLGRSVSLSVVDTQVRVAVGSRSSPNTTSSAYSSSMFSNVASVYEFDRLGDRTWTH